MIDNFVVIDFETANGKNACSIGIVEFENDKVVNEYYSLIKPKELKFNPFTSRIHGIGIEDVINEKEFIEIWEDIKHFFEDKIIVAHNYSFDLSVLNYSLELYKIDKPSFEILCTLKLAKKYLEIENNKLSTIAKYFKIDQNNYHNALEDAFVCGKVFVKFFNYVDNEEELKKISGVKAKSSKTSYPFWKAKEIIVRDLAFEKEFLNRTSNNFDGIRFVITGIFAKFYRNELKKSIEDNGGKVSSSISKKTNYIIAGDNMGPSKRTKAEELGIPMISEDDYLKML